MIAAVRVRGQVDVPVKIQATLDSIGIRKKNQVVLVEEDNEAHKGMLKKAKDYLTYGQISDETAEKIREKAGEENVVSLSPPSGGFKATKKNVNEGGALGKRDDMDELLHKML